MYFHINPTKPRNKIWRQMTTCVQCTRHQCSYSQKVTITHLDHDLVTETVDARLRHLRVQHLRALSRSLPPSVWYPTPGSACSSTDSSNSIYQRIGGNFKTYFLKPVILSEIKSQNKYSYCGVCCSSFTRLECGLVWFLWKTTPSMSIQLIQW